MARKLEVRNLRISFWTNNGTVKAVRNIGFNLDQGETLAIVGESGSGKSVTARAVMGILAGNAIVESGEIFYDGRDLLKISEDDFHQLRGNRVAMIFQDPLSSLNPVMKIGRQLTEAMLLNGKASQKDARREYKTKMSLLKEAMFAAAKEKNQDTASAEKNIRVFMDSMEKGSRMAGKYDAARENIVNAETELDGILLDGFHGKPAGTVSRIGTLLTDCGKCRHEYLISKEDTRFNRLLADLKRETDAYKKSGESAAARRLLGGIREILQAAAERAMPDFFTMAWWLAQGKSLPGTGDVAEMNRVMNTDADAAYMNAFRVQIADALRWSAERSMAGKRRVLEETVASETVFSGKGLSVSACRAEAGRVVSVVESSIDRLAIQKDSLAYTLRTGMDAAVEKLLAGRKLLAKKRKLLSKKKRAAAEEVDLELLQGNILLLVRRVRESYSSDLEAAVETDWTAAAAEFVDFIQHQCLRMVHRVTRAAARSRAIKLMEEVGIPEPRRRYKQYPFEFSGGMRQRIVIAIALSANPDILICDEPTTALDVTIQSQILELINRLKSQRDLSIIFITHDLGVVANMADKIAVMYAGKIVETGTADEVFYDPRHPYTWALLAAMPDLDTKEKLEAIPGTPPNMIFPPKGDAFAERNKYAMEIDFEREPPMFEITKTHRAATWLLHPDAPHVDPPEIVTDRIARMQKLEGDHD